MGVLSKILRISLALLLSMATALEAQEQEKLVSFTIKNAGINVKGTFHKYQVSTRFDPNAVDKAYMEVSIDVNSIDTGIGGRDKHLKKFKYFDAENYPNIEFQSTQVTKTATGYLVKGNLMIKETTKAIEIPFTVGEHGNEYILEGNFTLNRRDYGVGKKHLIMGNEVKVKLYHVVRKPLNE